MLLGERSPITIHRDTPPDIQCGRCDRGVRKSSCGAQAAPQPSNGSAQSDGCAGGRRIIVAFVHLRSGGDQIAQPRRPNLVRRCAEAVSLEQTRFFSGHRGLGAVLGIEFAAQGTHVQFDGDFLQIEVACDFLVGLTAAEAT